MTNTLKNYQFHTIKSSLFQLLPSSFLVAGNVLGVGLLALPIKLGLSGYLPSVLDIIVICIAMVISALVIAERLPTDKPVFDLPSFFHQEMGITGRWIAIICNLIILYGIIIAYLSGISKIIYTLIPWHISQSLIIVLYFTFATSLIVFGSNVLKRSSSVILPAIIICFVILVVIGGKHFNPKLLQYSNWKFIPLGLPVVISTFHFHNVIPTVSMCVNNDRKSLYKAIILGVIIGLIMNLAWTTIVLGSLPHTSIVQSFLYGIPATVPMSLLLNSKIFTTFGLIFAFLAITASYMANGSGLFGFIRDLLYTYTKSDNRILSGILAFIPTVLFALVSPNIFLQALDIVGGIGEAMLFAVLPGLILVSMMRKKAGTLAKILTGVGYTIFMIGLFVMIFVMLEKFGLVHIIN